MINIFYQNNSMKKSTHKKKNVQMGMGAIKVKEFRYEEAGKKDRNMFKEQNIPIRTLVEKMSSIEDLASHQYLDLPVNKKSKGSNTQVDMRYKKFIAPRDTTYTPKPFLFDRFNYENYQNYEYKNPYKPPKLGQDDYIMKPLSKSLKKLTNKNLQVIFCEHKLPQFVEKSNQQFKKYYQTKRKATFSNMSEPQVGSQTFNRSKSLKQYTARDTTLQKRSKRSTLANYLQQFNTLQKLSFYMEREHKLNQKCLFASVSESSRTVLLQILVHRFQFLKKMKKRQQQLVFKALLNLDQIPPYYKLNVHEYMKFAQIFISRDVDSQTLCMFVMNCLFKNAKEINFESGKKMLDQFGGTVSQHEILQIRMQEILKLSANDGQKIFFLLEGDLIFMNTFIDILLGKI